MERICNRKNDPLPSHLLTLHFIGKAKRFFFSCSQHEADFCHSMAEGKTECALAASDKIHTLELLNRNLWGNWMSYPIMEFHRYSSVHCHRFPGNMFSLVFCLVLCVCSPPLCFDLKIKGYVQHRVECMPQIIWKQQQRLLWNEYFNRKAWFMMARSAFINVYIYPWVLW